MSTALVSILIPAFNAEAWLADTIQSALTQTWPNKEIIVVDDGSKDGTLAIAKQFAGPNVTIHSQRNQGAAAARNKAFELSRGNYIQWLDADDLLSPNKIQAQMSCASEVGDTRALLSCSWGYFMYRPAKARFHPSPLWNDLGPVEWLIRKWEGNDHMQTATWLVSRELTRAAGPWNPGLSVDDDGEYFFRIIRASSQVRFVPEARVYYRITTASRLSYIGSSEKKMEAQLAAMRLQIGYLRSMADDSRARAACVNYLQTWLHNFYPNRPDLVEEAKELAHSLGGDLVIPRLSWKYSWIQKLFGWSAAKIVKQRYNMCKTGVLRSWDKVLFVLQRNGTVMF